MSPKFDARRVETIDYDFTAFDRYDAESGEWLEGTCTAVGSVPEPTDEILDEFMNAVDAVNAKAQKRGITHAKSRELMTEAMVTHLRIPREHLNELGPRHFNEFRDYVVLSLMNT